MRVPWVVAFLLAAVLVFAGAASRRPAVEVYKSPTCSCCSKWVAHLREHGFSVKTIDMPEVGEVKARNKVPGELSSCHTAVVGGYVIEGHVPAADILRLLKEPPPVRGLAVPGMPAGSPGMDGPNPEAYDVLSFDERGNVEVFSSHRP